MAHIVQSPQWGEFKTAMETPSVRVGDIQYTKHKIPFTPHYYAYCPKVDPNKIDWEKLNNSLKENNCIAVNFDVPNVILGTDDAKKATKMFKEKCKKSPRNTFAKSNVMLDLALDENELLTSMHKKHRYNIRLAEKKGVIVREAKTEDDFEVFYKLVEEAAQRQKYYIHSKQYFKTAWETLKGNGIAHILIAEANGTPLTAWMLFTYEEVLYYPYGGSSEKMRNLQASNLIGWEAIKFGKKLGCKIFDMWGAANDHNNKRDPWYGFTNFKMKFGGTHITYIDSYDYVANETMYTLFNATNELRWKILNIIK